MIKKICVFCGSSKPKNNSKIEREVSKMVKIFFEKKIELIYGGASIGLMGQISNNLFDLGGKVTGVIPKVLSTKEIINKNITDLIIVKNMHERKKKMYDLSDAFIVLPGGVGSMDELLEVMVSNQLGGINKPLGVLNTNGYYDSFINWLQRSVDDQFVSIENQNQVLVSDSPKTLLEMILIAEMPSEDTWINRLNVDFHKD